MVYNYLNTGMEEKVSLISAPRSIQTSDQHNFEIDKQAERMLSESYNRVKALLGGYKKSIKQLAEKLAE